MKILIPILIGLLVVGCGKEQSGKSESNREVETLYDEDKAVIEKALITVQDDWGTYKEVMVLLVDIKGQDKAMVKADFEKYFELIDEYLSVKESYASSQRNFQDYYKMLSESNLRGFPEPGSKLYEGIKKGASDAIARSAARSAEMSDILKQIEGVKEKIKGHYQ